MSAIDAYLRDLDSALHTRGRAKRRLLVECRDHLTTSAVAHGEADAIDRFGSASQLAAGFDIETASRRAGMATIAVVAGVIAIAASTLVLINAADTNAAAVVVWAVAFFACAQGSAVCMASAVLSAATLRHRPATAVEIAWLCRRSGWALALAAMTLFAAGAAVPGHASAWQVLSGPAVALLAMILVLRARSLARRLGARRCRVVRGQVDELRELMEIVGLRTPSRRLSGRGQVIVVTVAVLAAAGATLVWDQLDRGTLITSVIVGGTEATFAIGGFLLLGRALGMRESLRPRRVHSGQG